MCVLNEPVCSYTSHYFWCIHGSKHATWTVRILHIWQMQSSVQSRHMGGLYTSKPLVKQVHSLESLILADFAEEWRECKKKTKLDGLKESERENDNLHPKKGDVRDGGMALGKIKGPRVILHLFISFLYSFFFFSFVMVLMGSAFMPTPPRTHNRASRVCWSSSTSFHPYIHTSIPHPLHTSFLVNTLLSQSLWNFTMKVRAACQV